jgi:hypothetical protein
VVVLVEVVRKAYLASIVPVIVNAILNEHQLIVDIVAFVASGDFPRSRLGEKQRGKILASWVTRKKYVLEEVAGIPSLANSIDPGLPSRNLAYVILTTPVRKSMRLQSLSLVTGLPAMVALMEAATVIPKTLLRLSNPFKKCSNNIALCPPAFPKCRPTMFHQRSHTISKAVLFRATKPQREHNMSTTTNSQNIITIALSKPVDHPPPKYPQVCTYTTIQTTRHPPPAVASIRASHRALHHLDSTYRIFLPMKRRPKVTYGPCRHRSRAGS